MASNIVIALDGPAASGKGTLGRALAEKLDLVYFDTGKLYRAVGLRVIETGGDFEHEEDVLIATDWLVENFSPKLLENLALKSDEVGVGASKSAKYGSMRAKLLDLQQDFALNPSKYSTLNGVNGALLDGRDIGTVVAPNADVKLFITASLEKRAKRRLKELQNDGRSVTYSAILADMKARDIRDSSRDTAPMKPADDAVMLDTSDLDPEQTLAKALEIIGKNYKINRINCSALIKVFLLKLRG